MYVSELDKVGYLRNIPVEIIEEIFEAALRQNKYIRFVALQSSDPFNSFVWYESLEGFDYWDEMRDKYIDENHGGHN